MRALLPEAEYNAQAHALILRGEGRRKQRRLPGATILRPCFCKQQEATALVAWHQQPAATSAHWTLCGQPGSALELPVLMHSVSSHLRCILNIYGF